MENNDFTNQKTTGRGHPRLALLWIVLGTALMSALLSVLGVALYLKSTGLLGLTEMLALIRAEYFYYDEETTGTDALLTAALRGVTGALGDTYATYYTEEEYAKQEQSDSGEYKGLGVVVTVPDETGSVLNRVYEQSNAYLAGIRSGDKLLIANGTSVGGLTLEETVALLYVDGSENTLVLSRDGETYTVTVCAGPVTVPAVAYEMLEGNIGYIYIDTFHGHAVEETEEALTALTEAGMTALVLDLRDNPGGSLSVVLDVADLFLEKGLLVTSVRSRSGRVTEYKTKKDVVYDGPLCVLVNGGSASASELFTGALKDYGRATVIGTRTYGKGIVQTTFDLAGTGGHVKFTTDAYYTPNGVCIHGEGIAPDIEVELDEDSGEDAQLQTALDILRTGS